MSSLDENSLDVLDKVVMTAHNIFRKGKREAALRFLDQHKERAMAGGELGEASTYASIRGSYLVAMGRDSDALESYLEAERLGGDEAHSLLTTAWHLIHGMKQPEQALQRAETVLASKAADCHLAAHETRGQALMALDRTEEAIEELETVFIGIAQFPARSCDLALVKELSHRKLAPELCQRYLDLVESKARAEGEERILKGVLEIQALLR